MRKYIFFAIVAVVLIAGCTGQGQTSGVQQNPQTITKTEYVCELDGSTVDSISACPKISDKNDQMLIWLQTNIINSKDVSKDALFYITKPRDSTGHIQFTEYDCIASWKSGNVDYGGYADIPYHKAMYDSNKDSYCFIDRADITANDNLSIECICILE